MELALVAEQKTVSRLVGDGHGYILGEASCHGQYRHTRSPPNRIDTKGIKPFNKPIKQFAYRRSLVVVSWLHCIWDQDSTRAQSDFGRGFECDLVSSFGWHALQTTRVSVSELTYPVVLGWSWHWSPSRRLYRDWLGRGTVTYWVRVRVMADTDI